MTRDQLRDAVVSYRGQLCRGIRVEQLYARGRQKQELYVNSVFIHVLQAVFLQIDQAVEKLHAPIARIAVINAFQQRQVDHVVGRSRDFLQFLRNFRDGERLLGRDLAEFSGHDGHPYSNGQRTVGCYVTRAAAQAGPPTLEPPCGHPDDAKRYACGGEPRMALRIDHPASLNGTLVVMRPGWHCGSTIQLH